MKRYLLLLVAISIVFVSCQSEKKYGIAELQNDLSSAPSVFKIDPRQDTLLICDQGSVVFLDGYSLQFEGGGFPADSVVVTINEYYNTSDILMNDLNTRSGNRMLETGGMINISAEASGENLVLGDGNNIVIHFPKVDSTKNMSMFSSVVDSLGQINWNEEKAGELQLRLSPWVRYVRYDNLDNSDLRLNDSTNYFRWLDKNLSFGNSELSELLKKSLTYHYILGKDGELNQTELSEGGSDSLRGKILEAISTLPSFLAYTIDRKPIEMKGTLGFSADVIAPRYQSKEAYLTAFEKRMEKVEDLATIDQIEMNYYVFSSGSLGLINCDKFIDDPAPKVDFIVNVPQFEETTVKLIFNDFKGVLSSINNKGEFSFNEIPQGKSITVVALRYEEGVPKLATKTTSTGSEIISELIFKEHTVASLQKELERFN
ncbi:MAG: hypothetical protein ACJAZ2_000403 [Glaciecola sp.]|jgi:hypothetical protein